MSPLLWSTTRCMPRLTSTTFPWTKVVSRRWRGDGNDLRSSGERPATHGRTPGAELDLIAGGPPCQGFSLIGRRLVDDKRNQLIFHFFRLVSELRPRYFVMENVPGMARGSHATLLRQLVAEFEDAGYVFPEGKWSILNAADFGVPQERYRLFLIGSREDQRTMANSPLPVVCPVPKRVSEGVKDGGETRLPSGPTVWEALGDLPDLDRYTRLLESDSVLLHPATLRKQYAAASNYALRLAGAAPDVGDLSYPRIWNPQLLTSSMRTVHTETSIGRFRSTSPGETEPVSRFYRLDPGGLSNTLRAGSGSERGAFTSPRPIHPRLPRVLSNREAARLHSFPDWFRVHATKWHGFRQIGDAVAPLVGRAVGRSVVRALGADVKASLPGLTTSLGSEDLLEMRMQEAANHFGADRQEMPGKRIRGAVPGGPAREVAVPPDRPSDVAGRSIA